MCGCAHPEYFLLLLYKINITWMKVSQKCCNTFWKQNHWWQPQPHLAEAAGSKERAHMGAETPQLVHQRSSYDLVCGKPQLDRQKAASFANHLHRNQRWHQVRSFASKNRDPSAVKSVAGGFKSADVQKLSPLPPCEVHMIPVHAEAFGSEVVVAGAWTGGEYDDVVDVEWVDDSLPERCHLRVLRVWTVWLQRQCCVPRKRGRTCIGDYVSQAVLPFQPECRSGHPENYLLILFKKKRDQIMMCARIGDSSNYSSLSHRFQHH